MLVNCFLLNYPTNILQALLFSKNSAEDHLQDVVKSVTGICFLGTPHCGADLARWGSVVAGLANVIKKANVDLVNVLKTDSEVLARVQREFHTMLRGRTMGEGRPPLNITCFFEELPVRGAGEVSITFSSFQRYTNAMFYWIRLFQSTPRSWHPITISEFGRTIWT